MEGEISLLSAQFLTVGISIATIGVLFRNAEKEPEKIDILKIEEGIPNFFLPKTDLLIFSIAPVDWSAPATTNSMAIVNIPSLENPEKASFILITSAVTNKINAEKIAISVGKISLNKNTERTIKIKSVNQKLKSIIK